jgi:hypothetical protein
MLSVLAETATAGSEQAAKAQANLSVRVSKDESGELMALHSLLASQRTDHSPKLLLLHLPASHQVQQLHSVAGFTALMSTIYEGQHS